MDHIQTDIPQAPWQSPESLMFSLSSIRDDPLPNPPFLLPSFLAAVPSPPAVIHNKVYPPTRLTFAGPSRLKRRQRASPHRVFPSVHPIYASSDPQVVDLLAECSNSPLDACPITSQHPRWVLVVAALSVYSHPSYPAHLAFWRPDIMNETADMIDGFLKTREAKYLESREGWVNSEISLYTLRGHQRGYHPDLYSPHQSTRTLRKRKVGLIPTRRDDLDGILEDYEDRMNKKPRRTTRRSNPTRKMTAVQDQDQTSGSCLISVVDTPIVKDDTSLTPPVPMKTRSKPPPEEEMPSVNSSSQSTVPNYKKHRRRSSSMTSSGVSLSSSVLTADTLVEDEDDIRSVVSVDTVVENTTESRVAGNVHDDDSTMSLEKLALLVDVAAASAFSPSSPLSTLSLTPPPSPRRSTRIVQRPKRGRDIEEEEPSVRPRTRLASISTPSAPAPKRRSRVKKA